MSPRTVWMLGGLLLLGAGDLAQAADPPVVVASTPGAGRRTYVYDDGAVYPVLASPGRITDLTLQPGERLTGPLAAGDTARWILGDTTSGEGEDTRIHVLIKPTLAGLSTNLIINTTRRTYHLDLRGVARGAYPQVRWRYVEPPVVLVAAPPAILPAAVANPVRLNLTYRIKGPKVAWRPTRAFDDGRRTYVEFGEDARLADLPPLFLTSADGRDAELVNYGVEGRRIVVDRIFDRAELRLGQGRSARRVLVIREATR